MNPLPIIPPATSARRVSFGEAFRFWLKLGFISFGGPTGQIAIMHTELVVRRRWISERRFLHALNYCMLLPGPEATQLAIYVGWLLHDTWGGIVAGVLFVLPSVVILGALSALYVAYGHLPAIDGVLYGFKSAVVAVVLFATIRIGRRALRGPVAIALAAAGFAAIFFGHAPFPAIVLGAGLVGWIVWRVRPEWMPADAPSHGGGADAVIDDAAAPAPHTLPSRTRFVRHLVTGLLLWGVPLGALALWPGPDHTYLQMGVFFSIAALVTIGGAYAVLPFVAQAAVDRFGWLTAAQMADGLALGETTPGPLIMVLQFVGFIGGWRAASWTGATVGALVATWFTFLPSFLFILLGAPHVERLRGNDALSAPLTGITAAVVGVILNLAVYFALRIFETPQGHADLFAIALAAITFVGLVRFKLGVIPAVLGCGAIGLVWRLF
ncbi:MAG: chromate efflux transporter [Planctomycetes bacterium]|nr:chromate efflux transporter [Planctomycetota bacterium]MBI3846131.1 chromate efflux transporter [Planctomycetota bacterium]